MSRIRGVVKLGIAAVSIIAALLVWTNRQLIADQIAVWNYQPTDTIVSFVERSGMSETGRFYFYASQPLLEDADGFNRACERREEHTAVLGCYNGRTIYIYNVTDSRLAGIRSVTAAHEMLHAAYDRLSGDEKSRIDALLEKQYDEFRTDAALAERLQFYNRTEPGQRTNELHSIIGTEFSSLLPELERHYARYFSDRQKTVALHKSYDSIFRDLKNQAEKLSNELNELSATIERDTARYNTNVTALNQAIDDFNRRAQQGSFDSQEEFDAERSQLLARSDALAERRDAINALIARYETVRKQLLAVAARSDEIHRSIDSLAPAPSL